jgi:hypothetical protein
MPQEAIDAFTIDSSGRLILSTTGAVEVNMPPFVIVAAEEDLLAFTANTTGPTTTGTWAWHFDGTDVKLDKSNTDAVWIDSVNGEHYLSVDKNFDLGGGVAGSGGTIFVCSPGTLGSTTSCVYRLYWNAADAGLTENIDGLHIQR